MPVMARAQTQSPYLNKKINTAKRYLQTSGHQWESYRFDVISIGKQLDWIPGAFTLD
jgi:Holliday junction resolvase-like predicted endonuclease